MDRVTQITYPDNATIKYSYTGAGKVWKREDQRGINTYYVYDDVYNLLAKSLTIGSTVTREIFTYDGLGRMYEATKTENDTLISQSEFAYNDIGRISDGWETVLDSSQKYTQYAYDNAGFRTQTTYPDSTVVNRTNDWAGRIDTLTQGSTTLVDYSYIGARTAQRAYPEPDVTTDTTYDNLGRVVSIDAGAGYVKFDYGYVANENNIGSIQLDHRTNQPYNTFQYDSLDRITNVEYLSNQNDIEQFQMDDLGNRTGANTQRDGVFAYNSASPNLTNRYTAVGGNSLAYDAAGNLTLDKDGYHYEYDYENRTTRIYKLSGQTQIDVARYAYDALGRRIQRAVYWEGSLIYTDRFYYNDAWQCLTRETDYPGSSNIYGPVNYVYGNYIDELLLMIVNGLSQEGVYYYYLHDHLYSPVALLDSSGTVLERFEYDVYGARRVFDNSWQARSHSWWGIEFGLTGRDLDLLDWDGYGPANQHHHRLQHMHYRHRDYSPAIGRFMQQDAVGLGINFIVITPVEFSPKANMIDGIDLYSYVVSNSILYTDPYGLFSLKDCDSCGEEKKKDIEDSAQKWCDTRLGEIEDEKLRKCIKKQCETATVECFPGKKKGPNQSLPVPGLTGCSILNIIPGWCKNVHIWPDWWPDIEKKLSYGDVIIHEFAENCSGVFTPHDKKGVPGGF